MLTETKKENGFLTVRAYSAGEALPISGAAVFVYENDKAGGNTGAIRAGITKENGITDVFVLPTVSSEASLEPNAENAYIGYNIEIIKNGYYTVRNINVPIFAGITSIQPVAMIPVSEFSNTESPENQDRNTIEIIENEAL